MASYKILLRRFFNKPEHLVDTASTMGEPIVDVKNKKLYIGDGCTPLGFEAAELVVGPHDDNLYIKIEELGKYLPVLMKIQNLRNNMHLNVKLEGENKNG